MSQVVTLTIEGTIARVAIDNPPVNALGVLVRQGLLDAFNTAEATPDVRAIVIHALGRTFPAGADITEFGQPPLDPSLPDLCNRIEAAAVPVVAALHGTVLGGGLELALAAHYRIANPETRIGLPEVTLGILPGAGGTQRVPRITGAEGALDLMLSGRPMSVDQAQSLGLIDVLSEGPVLDAALEFARPLGPDSRRPTRNRRDGLADGTLFEKAIASRRAALADSVMIAPLKIVDCVEAALLLPFEAGLRLERAAFEDCVASDQSQALRHAFFAERRAAKVPEAEQAKPRPITTVGVIGGGIMGSGIAVALLDAGLEVVMVERDQSALYTGLGRVSKLYARQVEKGRMTPAAREKREQMLTGDVQYPALSEADLVIEAVIEDMAVKETVFAQLDAVLKPGAVLATNTSYLDIDHLATKVSRPADVIGLHFFSPAHIMKLMEIVVTDATASDVVATGFALARQLGKVPVRSGVTDGFIGNSILTAYRHATDLMLEDGASPYQVDAAMRAYGFPLGPYQVLDMAGLDISWARRKRLAARRDAKARYVAIGDKLCEAGRLGQKSGAGYYLYAAGERKGHEDPEVLALIARERKAKGIHPRRFSAQEIQARAVAAMANEGARLIARGIALRPSDVDTVMIHGYGFPRWRGGPMKAADLTGLLPVVNRLRAYAEESGDAFWQPATLFDDLIKNGQGFDALNSV